MLRLTLKLALLFTVVFLWLFFLAACLILADTTHSGPERKHNVVWYTTYSPE